MKKEIIENKKLHREFWQWCAKTGRRKCEWPRWKSNGGDIVNAINDCFACEIGYGNVVIGCDCPIIWGDDFIGQFCPCEVANGSPYKIWKETFINTGEETIETIYKRRKYATIIAEIKWKEK